jgi:hypothetical protein
VREWLECCDAIREKNGTRSLSVIAEEMGLNSATRVNDMLRGLGMPADLKQAKALLEALGATEDEAEKAADKYGAACAEWDRARDGLDQATRDADQPDWWERSDYIELVRRAAPKQLEDREDELAELAAWCTSREPGDTFAWWQAGPWAGKSALMYWLVLNPPPGTWVISFFVNGQVIGNDTSEAFTGALLDQLAAITGGKADPGRVGLTREGYCQKLLRKAAAHAAGVGRQLVLVVDGLDEDRSRDSGLASIAYCLRQPPRRAPGHRRQPPHPSATRRCQER